MTKTEPRQCGVEPFRVGDQERPELAVPGVLLRPAREPLRGCGKSEIGQAGYG